MNDLCRPLAPITEQAWAAIDDEARAALRVTLAGRKVADFMGPLGWEASAVALGRALPLQAAPGPGVSAALRQVQPLVELRVPFALARAELDALARGAGDADLKPVRDAARAIALAEDSIVFAGYAAAGIAGIGQAAAAAALTITEDYERYPAVVARALAQLREQGVQGPYAIALGPRCYTGLTRTATPAGFPVMQHVERLLDGPVIWAPGVNGAVVLSLRGGDFELTVGRDLSVGYRGHTANTVEFYIEESLSFRVLAEEAAVPLVYGAAPENP
ncbi:MAG: family 1 encapsulin nanocompartment shell protein [Pseudomonadota bacterium]